MWFTLLCFDAVHRYGAVELAQRPFQPNPNGDFNKEKNKIGRSFSAVLFCFSEKFQLLRRLGRWLRLLADELNRITELLVRHLKD